MLAYPWSPGFKGPARSHLSPRGLRFQCVVPGPEGLRAVGLLGALGRRGERQGSVAKVRLPS